MTAAPTGVSAVLGPRLLQQSQTVHITSPLPLFSPSTVYITSLECSWLLDPALVLQANVLPKQQILLYLTLIFHILIAVFEHSWFPLLS